MRKAAAVAAMLVVSACAGKPPEPPLPLGVMAPPSVNPPLDPAALPGCLGLKIDGCVQSLQASMATDAGLIRQSLERRHRVDVNGRRLAGGLVTISGTLPGRLDPVVVVLHLTPDDTVSAVETTLPGDPVQAHTEAEYDRTGLHEMTVRLVGKRCPEAEKLALYRFFENSVKPKLQMKRVDVSHTPFGGHRLFTTTPHIALCGLSFSYGAMQQWTGSDDPAFMHNLKRFQTIRLE